MTRRWWKVLLVLAALLGLSAPARADEFRPAYLQLTQRDASTYDIVWKRPALDEDAALDVRPEFPRGTIRLTPLHSSYADGIMVQRWRIKAGDGLEGKSIGFPSLSRYRIDVLARLERTDGTVQLERILPADPRFSIKASPGKFEVVQTYLVLGIEHILAGFDHLCFVLALVLIVRGTRRLLWTVTAFTLAHSITLALATLDIIQVPGPPVEATIALSIVFVAYEIVQQQRGREGLAARRPWLVAFVFGLLHGLGFAGALAEIGLPANAIPLALLFFNIGVEIGQLLFVGCVLTVMHALILLVRDRAYARPATIAVAYMIGGLASFWTIERVTSFWA